MKPELKKLLILNAPYLLFVYLFDKIGQAVRLSPGTDLSGKVLSLADGFSAAFANPLPSLAPMDLLIGIAGAVLIRLMVYFKGKNAKKYRKGIEYGSARWLAMLLLPSRSPSSRERRMYSAGFHRVVDNFADECSYLLFRAILVPPSKKQAAR